MELYSPCGEQNKPDLKSRQIVMTHNGLVKHTDFNVSEINSSYLTAEKVEEFATPSKGKTYIKKAIKK